MKPFFTLLALFIAAAPLFAQINLEDSTVAITAHWKLNDKRTYVYTDSYSIVKGKDTTLSYGTRSIFELTVVDSTQDGYKIKWVIKEDDVKGNPDIISNAKKINTDQILYVRTNSKGRFQEIINWTDSRDLALRVFISSNDLDENDPKSAELIAQCLETCNTHDKVANNVNQELPQYYYFHGSVCKWGWIMEDTLDTYPITATDIVQSKIQVNVDDINIKKGYYEISYSMVENRAQLTDVFYNYIKNLGADLSIYPTKESFPECITERTYSARYENETGWVIQSDEYNVFSRMGVTRLEKKTFRQIK